MKKLCNKHPKYQGKRKPTANCERCRLAFKALNHLRLVSELLAEHIKSNP